MLVLEKEQNGHLTYKCLVQLRDAPLNCIIVDGHLLVLLNSVTDRIQLFQLSDQVIPIDDNVFIQSVLKLKIKESESLEEEDNLRKWAFWKPENKNYGVTREQETEDVGEKRKKRGGTRQKAKKVLLESQ